MNDQNGKVAFCWQSSSLTGAQKRFLALVSDLNERGISAIVLLEKSDAMALEQIKGHRIPNVVSFQWPWWVKMLGRGRTRAYTLWSVFGFRFLFYFTSKLYLKKIQKNMGITLWHVSMSTHFANSVPGPALFEVTSPDWAERVIRKSRTVPKDMILHAVSESVYEKLVQALPERKILMAPLMFPNLDPSVIGYPDMEKKEKLIVFAHRLVPRKHGVLFAKVASRFLDENPEWRITIRGEGPDEEEIRRILLDHIKSSRAEVGYTKYLSDELSKSCVFVSIIEPDNYPSQSVLEAMIYGNALLLSDEGLSKKKFFDGNGCMVSIDENDIFYKLSALSKDVNLKDYMARKSHEIALMRFSRDTYIDYILSLYCKVHQYVKTH